MLDVKKLFAKVLGAFQDMSSQEVQDFIDSLDVGGGGTAVDLVVEQGTSGIWTYRKWSSGIAECWGTYATGSVSYSSYGNIYSGQKVADLPYPFSFVSVPTITATCSLYNWIWVMYVSATESQINSIRFGKSSAQAETQNVALYVIGKWK